MWIRHFVNFPVAALLWFAQTSVNAIPQEIRQSERSPRLVVQSGHAGIPSMTISPGGHFAATVDVSSGRGSLKIWNLVQGRLICDMPMATPEATVAHGSLLIGGGFAWSADAHRLAAVRDEGGLIVWNLERCGAPPTVVDLTPSSIEQRTTTRSSRETQQLRRARKAKSYDQLLTLSEGRALATQSGAAYLLRPFDPTPSIAPIPGIGRPAVPVAASGASPPNIEDYAKRALEHTSEALVRVFGASSDGSVILLGPMDSLTGSAAVAGMPDAGWHVVEDGKRIALRSFAAAESVPAQITMTAVSASGRWIALGSPSAKGIRIHVLDTRSRRMVGAVALDVSATLPNWIPSKPMPGVVGSALDGIQTIEMTQRAVSGMAFAADEKRLLLLRPRVTAKGKKDDPALESRRLPDLALERSDPLRGVVVPEVEDRAAFGFFGNALVTTPDRTVGAFINVTLTRGGVIARVDLKQSDPAVRTWTAGTRGVDAVRFDGERLLVARRLAGQPEASGSSNQESGGVRQLVAWTFALGSATAVAGELSWGEAGLGGVISADGRHWLHESNPQGKWGIALSQASRPGQVWERQFVDTDGHALAPKALALSQDGRLVVAVADRIQSAEDSMDTAGRVVEDTLRATNRSAQGGRDKPNDESPDSRSNRRQFNQEALELQNRLRNITDHAERVRISKEFALRTEHLRKNSDSTRREAREQRRARTEAALQGNNEIVRRAHQPRILLLDATSGATLGTAPLSAVDPLVDVWFAGNNRIVVSTGETFDLVGQAPRISIRAGSRLASPIVGVGARSGRVLIGRPRRQAPNDAAATIGVAQADTVRVSVDEGNTVVTNVAETMFAAGSASGEVGLYDLREPVQTRLRMSMRGQKVNAITFSPDDRILAVGTEQGEVALFSTTDGRLLARLYSFADGSWTVVDADGRFDTNRLESNTNLHWVMPDEPMRAYPVELLMRDYYEPRLLTRVLAGENFKLVRPVSELNRAQPIVSIERVEPERERPGYVTVTVGVSGTRDFRKRASGAVDLRLFRNGQLVADALGEGSQQAAAVGGDGQQKLVFRSIRLPKGREPIEFSAYAFNTDRVKSETVRTLFAPPVGADRSPARRAFVIAIGVNAHENPAWNLRFAANDARRAATVIAERLRATGRFAEVIALQLVSEADGSAHATKAAVQAALDALAGKPVNTSLVGVSGADRLNAATPDDVVFVLFSGHGYADGNGNFYLIPRDTGPGSGKTISDELLRRSISSDELTRWMRPIDAGSMAMVIDACHSAAAVESEGFKPGPMGSRGLGQLAYDKGIRILTASQADDVALEDPKLQHGLLTHALVNDGIVSARADNRPQDGRIELVEWLTFGAQRVPELYAEIKAGTVNVPAAFDRSAVRIQTGGLARQLEKRRPPQQPALFDFVTPSRTLTVSEIK